MDRASLDEPARGCRHVIHIASPVLLTAKDPQRQIVDVAVKGTRNVLEAARDAKSVRRFVHTSSVSAVITYTRPNGFRFTESDWAEDAALETNPYALSKTRAERALWDFHASLPPQQRFDCIAINPSVVLGPVYRKAHRRTSVAFVYQMLAGKMRGCPRFHFGVVDVRDVARAHAAALEAPNAKGRYLMSASGMWLSEAADILRLHFPRARLPRRNVPNFILYLFALIDKRLSFALLRTNLERYFDFDASRVTRELGIQYTDRETSLVDTGRSLIDSGFVAP
jgi:nucleoside-diphosphate-sugar epimerase